MIRIDFLTRSITFSLLVLSVSATTAQAQAESGSQGQPFWMQLLPLALIFLVFFLLVIFPQQRKMKKHRELVNNLKKGDEVVTSSGIFGKVQKIHEDQRTLYIEVSDKIAFRITKENIAQIISPDAVKQKVK